MGKTSGNSTIAYTLEKRKRGCINASTIKRVTWWYSVHVPQHITIINSAMILPWYFHLFQGFRADEIVVEHGKTTNCYSSRNKSFSQMCTWRLINITKRAQLCRLKVLADIFHNKRLRSILLFLSFHVSTNLQIISINWFNDLMKLLHFFAIKKERKN